MFYNKRKKLLTILTTAFVAVNIHGALASNNEIKIDYDKSIGEFVLSGNTQATREAVIFRLYPYLQDEGYNDLLSSESIEKGINAVFKTLVSDESGSISSNIRLEIGTDKLPYGRYQYDVISGQNKNGGIVILVDNTYMKNDMEGLNSENVQTVTATISNETISRVFDDGKSKDYTYMAQELINMKPDNGYDSQSFVDAYLIAEGLYYCHNGSMNEEDFFNTYAMVLGDEVYQKYKALDRDTKSAIGQLFKENIIQADFSQEFRDNVFAAAYYASKSFENMRTVFLEYTEQIDDFDMSDYNKLNALHKENVFTAMFNSKTKLCSATEIISEFEKNTKNELSKQRKENDYGGGASSGSSGGSSKGSSGGSVIRGNTPVENNRTESKLTDIEGHWARSYIETMNERKVITGYDDGKFRPDSQITRAEMAVMLSRLLNLSGEQNDIFGDVLGESWYAESINAAAAFGIIEGNDGMFYPDSDITRQDTAVMLKRILDKKRILTEAKMASYSDYDEVSSYAKEAINVLSQLGILNGNAGKINPLSNITRAEAAAMICRMINVIE